MGRYHGQTELLVRIAGAAILFTSLVTSAKMAGRLSGALGERGVDIGVLAYPLAFLASLAFLTVSITLVFAAAGGLMIGAEWLAGRWRQRKRGGL
jgi:hypothetical protein